MLSLLFLGLQPVPPVRPEGAREIVVIGRRLPSEDLAACIARGCPPGEEIELSLAVAVGAFYDGRYEDAKYTLRQSIRRNRGHEAVEPRRLAALHATLADVSRHEGDRSLQLHGQLAARRVLDRNLGAGDRDALAAGIALGDAMVSQGQARAAERFYRATQDAATRQQQNDIAASAAVRRASLANQTRPKGRVDERLAEAVALAGDSEPMIASIAVVRLQIETANRGPQSEAADTTNQWGTSARPIMIFSPPFPDRDGGQPAGLEFEQTSADATTLTDSRYRRERSGAIQWADIGFWILPDGTVSTPAVLRSSSDRAFANLAAQSLAARRYIPLHPTVPEPGLWRVERVSERANWDSSLDSRIRQRTGPREVHSIDMTHIGRYRASDIPLLYPTGPTPGASAQPS